MSNNRKCFIARWPLRFSRRPIEYPRRFPGQSDSSPTIRASQLKPPQKALFSSSSQAPFYTRASSNTIFQDIRLKTVVDWAGRRFRTRMSNNTLFVFSAVLTFWHQLSRGFAGPMYFFATTISSNQTLLTCPGGDFVIYKSIHRKFKFNFSSLRH